MQGGLPSPARTSVLLIDKSRGPQDTRPLKKVQSVLTKHVKAHSRRSRSTECRAQAVAYHSDIRAHRWEKTWRAKRVRSMASMFALSAGCPGGICGICEIHGAGRGEGSGAGGSASPTGNRDSPPQHPPRGREVKANAARGKGTRGREGRGQRGGGKRGRGATRQTRGRGTRHLCTSRRTRGGGQAGAGELWPRVGGTSQHDPIARTSPGP